MAEQIAASKVSVSVEKLRNWENGRTQPTIRQAQKLAKIYKRPFALFFLPEIPRDFEPLQDFRKKGSRELGTSSIFIIREIQQKQSWISEVYEDSNEKIIPFFGKYSIKDNPANVANDILKTLRINPTNYENENPMKEWVDKAESNGIFISRTSFIHSRLKLDIEEIQGFAIADKFAPFVFVNTEDWNAPQLFTLVHELAHIWIAETGVSNDIQPDLSKNKKINPIELFCNEVAANALMPSDLMNKVATSTFDSVDDIYKKSKILGVSTFSFLVRALNLNIITLNNYFKLKKEADYEYEEFLTRDKERKIKQKAKHKKGGPNYYLLQLNKNSRLFTQTVLDAFRGGIIEPTQASFLLNVQVTKFSKLEAQLYK